MGNSGIIARTYDDKEYYFYTDLQSDVENAMLLMGYTTYGYSLGMFKDRPEPDGEFEEKNEKIKKKEPFIKFFTEKFYD